MVRSSLSPLLLWLQDHREELIGYLIQRKHCPETASDIIQDAYLRLAERKDGDKSILNPRAFLYRVVGNLSIDYHRSAQRREQRFVDESELAEVADQAPSLEQQLYTHEKIALLQKAISELPPKCRQVFIMHKLKHYPYSRIMAELDISESTVLKHMVKATEHCRKRLQEWDISI